MKTTSAENRYLLRSRFLTMSSTAHRSYSSNPRPIAYVSIFCVKHRLNSAVCAFKIVFSSLGPRNDSPEGSVPEESTGPPPS